jgi:MFS family permease
MTTAPQKPGNPNHDPYAAFRYTNYRFYALGNFLSVAGQQMLTAATQWEIFERTHSPLALGLTGLVLWVPIFLLILPAGSLADRYNRRNIVILAQFLFVACSLGLAWVSRSQSSVVLMFILLFLIGVSRALSDPAKQSLLPQLVSLKDFPNAVSWNSTAFQIASMTGPALCGFLIAYFGCPVVYLVDALCGLAFISLVWSLHYEPRKAPPEALNMRSLGAGLKFVWNTKIILATITLDLFAVVLGGATALLPAISKDILHVGPVAFGWLRAALPIGAFCMAIILAHMPPMKRSGRALLWAVAGFGMATILFGFSQWFWFSFLALFLIGAFDNISVIVRHTLVQVLTPDRIRGRVSAVSFIFIHSSNELGAFESGLVAAWLGVVPSVVLGGFGSLLVVLGVMVLWPQVLKLKSLAKPV